jgi:prolyl-tRNA synthetase
MKLSKLFTKTTRETSSEELSKNAQLLLRAGLIHKTMPGVYSYLPLGLRVLNKIENIVRKNMDELGAQEIFMNSLHPKSWWDTTDRWDNVDVLFKLESQTESQYALAPTHEEQISNIAKEYINSHKDLGDYSKGEQPMAIYQIQTKFRDEIRSKAGLMRGREFRMKDLYDFHRTQESLDAHYEAIKFAYLRIFREIGIEAFATRASGGIFCKFSDEFQVICEAGEDWMVEWSDGIKENIEIAKGYPLDTNKITEGQKKFREDLDNDVKSAQDHADDSGMEVNRIFKSVLFVTKEDNPRYVAVCIRGDLEINEELLIQSLDWGLELRIAEEEDLKIIGTQKGRFTSIKDICVNYRLPIYWIFDKSVENARGMVASLYTQVDIDRDCIEPNQYSCVAEVTEGFCREDNIDATAIRIVRSAEVGNIFKLGNRWTKAFEIKYKDENNQDQYPIMGCHGIGTSRCMGVVAEIFNDSKGLKWPESISPFSYHLITNINPKDTDEINSRIIEIANNIYRGKTKFNSKTMNFEDSDSTDEVLWDDRSVNMGEKLSDSELIGCPITLIISRRSLESGGIEVRFRDQSTNTNPSIGKPESIIKI